MTETNTRMVSFGGTRVLLRLLGVGLLLVGLVGAFYGPLEIFVFYLFSEGGRFYYPGFGFGSLWFGYLVMQNLGYYLVAAICIPLGLGHIWLHRWALTLARLFAWFWLGGGLLLFVNILWLAPAFARLDLSQGQRLSNLVAWGIFGLVGGLLLPALAVWFYSRGKVKAIFEEHDPHRYWTERYPFPLLAVLLLFLIIIILLHLAAFFQGLFPLFGRLLLGRSSAAPISLCVLIAGILIYGLVRLKRWAWWGALIYTASLAIASLLTFGRYSLADILDQLNLPAYEMEFLDGIALLGEVNLMLLFTAPLMVMLGLIIYSKRDFGS